MKRNTLYRLDELAVLPTTKAELEQERVDFNEAVRRAEAKGDRAIELLNSPECDPRRSPFALAKVSDYEVEAKGRLTK